MPSPAAKIISVLRASIKDVRLTMTKDQVSTLRGQPTSKIPVQGSDMETWEYEDLTVLFESGKVTQVIGRNLSIGTETLTAPLPLKDLAEKLGLNESDLPRPTSGPNSRSIPLEDGSLVISQSKGQVLNYGLELPRK